MISVGGKHRASSPGRTHSERRSFLKWQCRVRQIAVRERAGRPDESVSPTVELPCGTMRGRRIVTVICRKPEYSKTPELMHIAKRSNDPAQRRDDALKFLAAEHYQQPSKFSDTLVASFSPGSEAAMRMVAAGFCTLEFRAYSQRYRFDCAIRQLEVGDPIREAAWWHNLMFNPGLSPDAVMLGFDPDWRGSISESVPPTAAANLRRPPTLAASSAQRGDGL